MNRTPLFQASLGLAAQPARAGVWGMCLDLLGRVFGAPPRKGGAPR